MRTLTYSAPSQKVWLRVVRLDYKRLVALAGTDGEISGNRLA